MYRPFPASWQIATSPCNTFPPPSLKFRTSGFPQYGFKLEFNHDLRQQEKGLSARSAFTHSLPTCTWPKLLAQTGASPQLRWFFRSRALSSNGTPFNIANSIPVQRPLARQWVMLSHRVIAYYDLIRNSRPSHRFIYYYDGSLPYDLVWAGIERLPNLLHVSFPSVPPSVPRWTERLHMAVPSPFVLAFALFIEARHPQPTPPVLVWDM